METVSEQRMVAAFLKAEIDSPRWRDHILDPLARDRRQRSIVDCPDLVNAFENEYRASLLSFRGYKQNDGIFSGFPDNAQWQTALLDTANLEKVKVMNRAPWPEFSGGSRIASDVAENFKSGRTKHEVLKEISGALNSIREGKSLPELILVGSSLHNDLVVMEGHVRVTAILMSDHEYEIAAVIGRSENISKWSFY